MPNPEISVAIPEKLRPIFEPKQFKVMHGGRGGGKSHTVAQALIVFAMSGHHRILCVREVQKSLAESSKRVIEDYIKRMGLSAYFEVTQKPDCGIVCKTTGSTFSFSGLKDHTADSIKSFEGATLVWVEEAHSVTAHSWNILIPTIVRTDGAEIWATFNPDQETDYVYERFVRKTDPDTWVVQINWRDNPWFNEAMDKERLKLKSANDDLYQHVWEGKCRTAAGLLFKRRWFKRYPLGEHPANLRKYMSTDYAGAPDADNPESEPDWNEFGVGGMDSSGALWLVDWYSGQEDVEDWLPGWLMLVRKHKPLAVFEEKGPILRAISGVIDRAMQRSKTWALRHDMASASSKADRALGFAAYASQNDVWIPECEWGDRLVAQLCAFTGQDGKVDDMVDVVTLFGRGVDEMADALPELTESERGVKPFSVKWLNSGDRPATPAKRFR